jgi:hypothetical protein
MRAQSGLSDQAFASPVPAWQKDAGVGSGGVDVRGG